MLSAVRRAACCLIIALGVLVTPAHADLRVFENVQRYTVDAKTKVTLRRQFRELGPKGFAGFTRWVVTWTRACDVRVRITYTLPQHANLSALPQDLAQRFEQMVAQLEAHERLHGQNGIRAGQEIVKSGCQNGQAIIRKYAQADRRLDRETEHGKTQGVTLN